MLLASVRLVICDVVGMWMQISTQFLSCPLDWWLGIVLRTTRERHKVLETKSRNEVLLCPWGASICPNKMANRLRACHISDLRGDLLGVSITRMLELDVTFVHTTGTAVRTQGAHKEAGKSVKIREDSKRKHHAKAGTSGYTYTTLAHETHACLGDEAKEQIRMLADEACSHSSVQISAFGRNLKTEISVATVKGNALVFQSCICQMARNAGKAFQKGATCPHTEVR